MGSNFLLAPIARDFGRVLVGMSDEMIWIVTPYAHFGVGLRGIEGIVFKC